jgi:hypothetical protein
MHLEVYPSSGLVEEWWRWIGSSALPQEAPSWLWCAPAKLPPTATLKQREQTLGLVKTIKTDQSLPQEHETPQTTTAIGLQFIDHLKSAKDKT